MSHRLNKLSLLTASAMVLALAACGGGGGSDSIAPPPTPTPSPPPPPPVGSPLEMLGAGFGTLLRASNNTDPRDPTAADLVQPNLTTDPFNPA